MTSIPPASPRLRLLFPALISTGYLLVFLLLSQASLSFHIPAGAASWYPPTGLSFALLLAGGLLYTPLVFLALLVSAHWIFQMPFTLYLVAFALLNALGYGLAASVLRRVAPRITRLSRLRDILWFILASAFVPLLLAGLSVPLLVLGEAVSPILLRESLLQFWTGGTLSNLMLAPALLIAFQGAMPVLSGWKKAAAPWLRSHRLILAQSVTILFLLVLAFGLPGAGDLQAAYLLFLPLLWVTLQSGLPGAALADLGIGAGSVLAVRLFDYPLASFEDLQAMLLLLALVGLVTGGSLSEARQARLAENRPEPAQQRVSGERPGAAALRRSQADQDEAERLAHLGYFRCTLPSGQMELSEETRRILEWEPSSPAPHLTGFLRLVHPEDQDSVYQQIDRIRRHAGPLEFRYRVVTRSGRVKVIQSTGEPVLDHNGEVNQVFGTLMDITAQQQAEAALRENQSRYKELSDSISDVFFGLDRRLRITYWNRASAELTGIPAEKALGRALYELFPGLKGSSVEQFALEAFRTGQHQGFVMEYTTPARKRYLEVSAYPGQHGVSVFMRDVTERQVAEERLRLSEARYRAVVEDQTDLICRFLPDATVTFANEAYSRAFARPRKALIGQKLVRFRSSAGSEEPTGQHTSLRGASRAWTYECQVRLPDEKLHWLQWTDRPILDDHGRVVEFQSVGRDISDSKRLEEELRYLSTHDSLTGIYNRAFFETELSRLQRSRQYPISLLMVDVNGLKQANDTFGHPAGDELLKRAARVLSSCFRPEDVVSRFGGDEFAVLLPATDARAAEEVVRRVRTSLDVYNRGSGGPALSLSVGIASAEKGASLVEVLSRADEYMYQDKLRQREDP